MASGTSLTQTPEELPLSVQMAGTRETPDNSVFKTWRVEGIFTHWRTFLYTARSFIYT